MKLNQAKKFYKKSQNDGLENQNSFEIFKKINYELVRALRVVSDKIEISCQRAKLAYWNHT